MKTIEDGYVRLSDVYELIDRGLTIKNRQFPPEQFHYFLEALKKMVGERALTDVWIVTGMDMVEFKFTSRIVKVFDNKEAAELFFDSIRSVYDFVFFDHEKVFSRFEVK